jgi:hypothetical protein
LAKKNFGFEKRQKELKKKQKQEEKRLRKLERAANGEAPEGPGGEEEADTKEE